MDISIAWLNEYFSPSDAPVTAEEAGAILTDLGFPVEETTPLPDGDLRVDFELTSNRGDCACHVGFAREIAAKTGRTLSLPEVPVVTAGPVAGEHASVEIEDYHGCPRYTGWVITGCMIGPSPDWLVRHLEAVGQRSINNAVDVTNFVLHELGQPTHVFDMKKLAQKDGKPAIIVRRSRQGEKLITLDDVTHELPAGLLVIADPKRPVALAGVMGGAETEVDNTTVDILLEAASFDPVSVRTCARRLKTMTDSSYRFERIVEPRTVEYAARRCAQLIAELTGGTLQAGFIDASAPLPQPLSVTLRCERCRAVLGIDIDDERQAAHLRGLQLEPVLENGAIRCTIPPHRTDLEREADLIEEVARLEGFGAIPIHDRLQVIVHSPQPSEQAKQRIREILTGLGFFETVTFSFTSLQDARPFLPAGLELLKVEDERRKAEPYLRPSVLSGLLHCRKANQDAGIERVRLFELAAAFAQREGKVAEERRLAILADADDPQEGLRLVRTAVSLILRDLAGTKIESQIVAEPAELPAFEPNSHGLVTLGGKRIGSIGLISQSTQATFGVKTRLAAAELSLAALIAHYPQTGEVRALPQYPHIERDLSVVVDEETPWSALAATVEGLDIEFLEDFSYVTTFRGKQVPAGKKSVTLRLRFRDEAGTLRHEQVDPQAERIVKALEESVGAELRA